MENYPDDIHEFIIELGLYLNENPDFWLTNNVLQFMQYLIEEELIYREEVTVH